MSVLAAFDTPGGLRDMDEQARASWSATVSAIFGQFAEFPQLYDPTVGDTPDQADRADIVWTAFPARLLRGATSEEARWQKADQQRDEQDEYCEWSVERNGQQEITRVTFTCEVPEYFEQLAAADPKLLASVYSELVGATVPETDLIADGSFQSKNKWNRSPDGPLAHLSQGNNTLGAAVDLVAQATIPREDAKHQPVTSKQLLAQCAGLGDQFRNSDPQIAASVNAVARGGDEITLLDPIGLYIDGLNTTGMRTPDGTDPAKFWTVERGEGANALRASYQVGEGHDYNVSQIISGDRPISFGAQLADRVRVRISAMVKAADHHPASQACN